MSVQLFVETSNLEFQLALFSEGSFLYRSDEDKNGSEGGLQAMFSQARSVTGMEQAELGEIVVDTGPGGLTSTRSGVAFSNGLSFATGVPVIEVNSLELMVLDAQVDIELPVVSARRSNDGNYFMGFFHRGKCLDLTFGKPDEVIQDTDWHASSMHWIGPYPSEWQHDRPPFDLTFVDLLSPGLDAFAALLPCLGKTCLVCINDGIVSQGRLCHEAPQPPGAPFCGNQHVMDPEPSQVYQVTKVFMRPAGH